MSNTQETSATSQEPNSQFPFLQLTRELRHKVYRELLLSKTYVLMREIIMEVSETCTSPIFPGKQGLHPGILRTCKQVHDEAADVLYGENVFPAIPNLDTNNRNASRVRRTSATVNHSAVDLARFLDDHPDLTHLFLYLTENALETESVLVAVEEAVQRHHGLVHLEVCVTNSEVYESFIVFCWRLYTFIRRNRAAIMRLKEVDLHGETDYPFFLLRHP